MTSHAKPFPRIRIMGVRWENPMVTSPSPLHRSFQQAHEAICIIGLVFTLSLLIPLTFGSRRRHPVVIAFISTAILNYLNGLLPWFFNFWSKPALVAVGGTLRARDYPTHIACRVNGVFGSYLQTVIPSFAAAFIGEALRITWRVWKMTDTSSSPISFQESMHHKPTPSKPIPCLAQENDVANLTVHPAKNIHSDLFHNLENPQSKVVLPSYRRSNDKADRKMEDLESMSVSAMCLEHSTQRTSTPIPGSNGRGGIILCLVPILCGLPQLLLILIDYLHTSEAWIFLDIISCRVRSKAVETLAFTTLLSVLALTASLCVIMLWILCGIRRSVNKHGMSKLDKGFLIRIGLLTFQSFLGCLVVSMIYLQSDGEYHAALDFFGIINPVISAMILTNKEFFTIWYAWIYGFVRLVATRLGLKKLNCYTSLSSKIVDQVSNQSHRHKKDKESVDSTNWVPPKPSYQRCHRPISTSVSVLSDLDIDEPENYSSQGPFSFRNKISRQIKITRPSRFLSFRKINNSHRPSEDLCGQIGASRRKGLGVLRRAVSHRDRSVPAKTFHTRRNVLTEDFAHLLANSPNIFDATKETRHSSLPHKNSKLSAQLKISSSGAMLQPLPQLPMYDPIGQADVMIQCSAWNESSGLNDPSDKKTQSD